MVGRKLLILRPKLVDDKDPSKFKNGQNTIVAVDTVGQQQTQHDRPALLRRHGVLKRAVPAAQLLPQIQQ